MTSLWLSCYRMTVYADINDQGIIIDSSPVVKKFIGQPVDNLRNWFKKLGGFREAILSSSKEVRMKIYAGIGSRKSPPSAIRLMEQLGYQLAKAGWGLRSGGADGADTAFERGCDRVDGRKSIYIPWEGFNNRFQSERGVHVGVSDSALALTSKYHPNWSKCSRGARLLHGRNAYQVLGPNLDQPAQMVICWHNGSGGTTQACRIAEDHGIEVINMFDYQDKKRLARLIQELME